MEWDRPRSSEIPGREDRKGGQGGALKELRRHPEGHQGPRHVLRHLGSWLAGRWGAEDSSETCRHRKGTVSHQGVLLKQMLCK